MLRIVSPLGRSESAEGWGQVLRLGVPAVGVIAAGVGSWLTSQPLEVTALIVVSGILALSLVTGYRLLLENDQHKQRTPVLHFGDAHPSDETVDETPATLWRVRLENTQVNTQAENVRVRLESSEPPLKILPVSLHEMHDNRTPFRKQRNIAYGEPIVFDFISQDWGQKELFYVFRSDTALEVPDDMMDIKTGNIILDAARSSGGFKFKLRAISNPPARGIEQAYRLIARIPDNPDEASIHGLVVERVGDEITL